VFAQFSEKHLAFPLAFAGSAVLASLADTLSPKPSSASMTTAAGFLLSFILSA